MTIEEYEIKLKEELLQERETYWSKGFECAKKKYTKQLAKAKDILQRLMESQPAPSSMYEEIDLIGWRAVNKEAEQFLKEV